MHSTSVEIKGGVLFSWVASVVTMVARGAAKKMIVKKLQTSPSRVVALDDSNTNTVK